MVDSSRTPPDASTSPEEAIAYYKAQYEQLESELADFQLSSRDLEAELERDVEESEKRERGLKAKVEAAEYEIDEWKTKYKKSKAEASAVQSTLQKEITSLRDAHRTLQLKLRDIEVANDDYERQARHTTSSLEDMESKYNVAIERGVLLEEEVKTGEQEREKLRIENQRLRDELADLKVETHIIQEKLKKAEVAQAEAAAKSSTKSRPASRKSLPAPKTKPEPSSVTRTRARAPSGPPSPSSLNTTKTRSSGSLSSNSSNPPPVPPLPEKPPVQRKPSMQPTMARLPRKSGADPSFPKSGARGVTRHSRVASQNTRAAQAARAQSARNAAHANANGIRRISELPQQLQRDESPPAEAETASNDPAIGHAGSLYQIRGLIGKMQKLEDRIQSARSRLPAPTESSPRASSRTQSKDLPHGFVSLGGSLTMRNTLSRASGSGSITSANSGDSGPSSHVHSQQQTQQSQAPHLRRQSVGQQTNSRSTYASDSRPSSRGSRASISGRSSVTSTSITANDKPLTSGTSLTSNGVAAAAAAAKKELTRRPRSSISTNSSSTTGMANIEEGDGEPEQVKTPIAYRNTNALAGLYSSSNGSNNSGNGTGAPGTTHSASSSSFSSHIPHSPSPSNYSTSGVARSARKSLSLKKPFTMPITPSSATSGKTGIPPPPSLINHTNYTNSNGASATSASATANHTKTLSDASWSSASAAARKHSTNSSPSPVAAATMRSRRLNGAAAGEGDPSGNYFPGTPSRSGLTPERRTLRTQPNFSADLGETF